MSTTPYPALSGALIPTRFQTPQLTTIATTTAQELVIGPASTNQIKMTSSVMEFNVGTVLAKVKLPTATENAKKGLLLWIKCKGTTGTLTVQNNAGTTAVLQLATGESAIFICINGVWHTFRPAPPVTEGATNVTLAGTLTMDLAYRQFQRIDGGVADRDVLLPTAFSGAAYYIDNVGTTNSLLVKTAAGVLIDTLTHGVAGWFVYDGSSWRSFKVAADARTVRQIVPMGVLGLWGKDIDGARTNGGGLCGVTPALTALAAAQCKVDNGGVFGNIGAGPLAGYTSNWQIYPDVPADNDAVYVGRALPFCEVAFDIGVAQASTGACITPEYWNGAAWVTLTNLFDNTSAAATDGTRPFERDGAITFVPPADWAQTTIDGVTIYWIRFRISTVANIGVALGTMNAKTPDVVAPGSGFIVRSTGTIVSIRLSDNSSTLHTANDVKWFLMNYTTGVHSGLLTFAQDVRTGYWSGLTMAVADGDELGAVCIQEDGTNEPLGVLLELGLDVT